MFMNFVYRAEDYDRELRGYYGTGAFENLWESGQNQ